MRRQRKPSKQRNARREQEVDIKETELTSLVFGDAPKLRTNPDAHGDTDQVKEETLSLKRSKRHFAVEQKGNTPQTDSKGAAWKDNDDRSMTITSDSSKRLKKLRDSRKGVKWQLDELERRLRDHHGKFASKAMHTNWASVEQADGAAARASTPEGEQGMQSESSRLFARTSDGIPPNSIDMVRLQDANALDQSDGVLRTVSFHPESDPDAPLLMTAGLDKSLRFYAIGKDDEARKVHGVHFPKLPIYKASYLPASDSILVTGRRSYFYLYNMVAGKVDFVPGILGREEKSWESHSVALDGRMIALLGNDGYIVLMDPHSKQPIGSMKLNGSVRSVAFSPSGNHLFASGSDGDITRWDIGTRRCIERFFNNDGTITSSLAVSENLLAAGAESGVVNLYANSSLHPGGQKQIRSIMNLPTMVDNLRFNHDGQLLAMSSRFSSDCLKLLHVPSRTVFANWPTSKTPLNYVFSSDFSPQSRYLSVGNDKGKCLLYKLKHYST